MIITSNKALMTCSLFANAKGQIPMSFLYSKNVLLHVIIITIFIIFTMDNFVTDTC